MGIQPDCIAAIDVGGTFTDIVVHDGALGCEHIVKVPSTPPSFWTGLVRGLQETGLESGRIRALLHGTTAHLNALLEGKGTPSALITTAGFGDVLAIRRGNRPRAYDLHFRHAAPLVQRRNIFEIRERMDADGAVLDPLDTDALAEIVAALRQRGLTSVAVCFLHSYANPAHEIAVFDYFAEHAPEIFVAPSHLICRESREYERSSTAVLNAYVSPILRDYLRALRDSLDQAAYAAGIYLLQSNGGLMRGAEAELRGALTLMSGPVGGNVAARALSRQIGRGNLICIDMGGTSFEASLVVDGDSAARTERELAGYPLLAPTIDIHTIGAGGGSIARAEAGALRVGPQSAGADPGPACYGRGGTEATVTDANLMLGRLQDGTELAAGLALDRSQADQALTRLGDSFGLDAIAMAEGVLAVIDEQMANAIRTITVQRGIDPRDFSLVAYGGAGPMHAASIARRLGVREVIVPPAPGAFSAWGMLRTEIRYDAAVTLTVTMRDADPDAIKAAFADLEQELSDKMAGEGVLADAVTIHHAVDMRYASQEYAVTVPVNGPLDLARLRADFDAAYERSFGHMNAAEEAEIVTLRATARSGLGLDFDPMDGAAQAGAKPADTPAPVSACVHFDGAAHETPILARDSLQPGDRRPGPAIIMEETCTTVVPPQTTLTIDHYGTLILTLEAPA